MKITKFKNTTSHKNLAWWMFFIVKILIPTLTLIVIPIVPIVCFNTDMIDLSLKILLTSDEEVDLAIELLKQLNMSINYLIGALLFFTVLNFWKKQNANKLFNANGNIYYSFFYPFFWIASNILGYEKVQLAGIPLQLQYKLVLRGTFPQIITDAWENHYDKNENSELVEITYSKKITRNKEINLIISDTYFINDEEISLEYRELSSIRVTSKLKDRRYLNNELVQKTREAMGTIRANGYTSVYVLSTANPQNNLNIINSTFRFFGRFVGAKIYVMQKSNGINSEYKKKYRII